MLPYNNVISKIGYFLSKLSIVGECDCLYLCTRIKLHNSKYFLLVGVVSYVMG